MWASLASFTRSLRFPFRGLGLNLPSRPGVNSLSPDQASVLRALAAGYHLKSHRYLDGEKVSRLHAASGQAVCTVSAADVAALEAQGYIAGNMKFPAAVYLLTEQGARVAATLAKSPANPLNVRLPAHPR